MLEGGKIVMIGVICNRMYRLNIEVIPPETTSTALASTLFGIPTVVESKQTSDIWYKRFAHLNHATIQKMASQAIVTGLVLDNQIQSFCPGCAYGKHSCAPFPVNELRARSQLPGDLIHSDLCGPMNTPLVGGALYFILFKDDYSGFRVIKCIKSKPDTLAAFQRFVAQIKREIGNTIKIVRNNRGIEYTNAIFTKYLQEQAIRQELTAPYTPE